jgi:hypothetical protein
MQSEAISKRSFGPISALGAWFKSSKYLMYSSGLNLAAALTLNQNPIFEIASRIRPFARLSLTVCANLLALRDVKNNAAGNRGNSDGTGS